MAEILITAGADLNAKDRVTVPGAPLAAANSVRVDGQNGRTPLHWAAVNNQCQVAEILIAAGADLNAKSNQVRQSLARLSLLLKVCCWMDRMGKPLCTGPKNSGIRT